MTLLGLFKDQIHSFFYWTFCGRYGKRGLAHAVYMCRIRYGLWRRHPEWYRLGGK